MNFQKMYDKKNENLLLTPIYKLNFGPKSSQESQTSATGSGSENSLIQIQKNLKKNKTYSILNFQKNKNILTNHNFGKNNLINTVNNKNNLIQNSLSINNKDNYVESFEKMNIINNKSRNNKVLNNIKTFNIRSTNDLRVNSTLNNYQTTIQKILKKHKISLTKRKLEIPNLLIKDTDITKKRYYFGFMSFENENKKNSNNNKNILTEKQIISHTPNLKKKIIPLKKKPKISIDELIKKKFPENIEKNLIEKINKAKKLKLKPLKKSINIKLQESKIIIPENKITNNYEKLSSNDNLQPKLKLIQCKSYEKINNESKTERKNYLKKPSNLKSFNKKISLSSKLFPKIVKFEPEPINYIEKLENKKKIFIKEKEIEIDSKNEKNETKFGFNFAIEEQSSREYEEDNYINSDDNYLKKRKKNIKRKKEIYEKSKYFNINFK